MTSEDVDAVLAVSGGKTITNVRLRFLQHELHGRNETISR